MELNLNGGIFVHSELAGRFDWSSAIKLGILKTSKRLRGTEGESERAGPSASSNVYAWLSRALIGDAEIDVDDFIVDGNYWGSDDIMEIIIDYNPDVKSKILYDLVGELNQVVAHEIRHIDQRNKKTFNLRNKNTFNLIYNQYTICLHYKKQLF